MKTRALIVLAIAFCVSTISNAQKKGDKEEQSKFDIAVGGSFAKPKIIPAMDKLALVQIRIDYKMTTTARAMTNAKKDDGMIAGAKITASLETTDGQLVPADFQEITDHFYNYFQKALQDGGIGTVDWATVAMTDFYQTGKEDTKEKTESSGNVYFTSVANNGGVIWGGFAGLAFGKAKKATKFCEEVGAPAGFFNMVVEFAE